MRLCTDTYERLRTCTGNVLDHFRSYRHENKFIESSKVVFSRRIWCWRPFIPSSSKIDVFIHFHRLNVFCNLFVFEIFVKILILNFCFPSATEPKSLPRRGTEPPSPRQWRPPRRFYALVLHMGVANDWRDRPRDIIRQVARTTADEDRA